MTKKEIENEMNNKSTGINEGKSSTVDGRSREPLQASETGSGQGLGNEPGNAQSRQPGQPGDEGVLAQVSGTGREIASKSLNAIGEKTRSTTEGYKSDITGGLHTLAEGLRQASSSFNDQTDDNPISSAGARYIGDLATKIESVSGYFERKDAADLVEDVKGFARRNPTVFVGSAFALGFACSRLIRSGAAPSMRG